MNVQDQESQRSLLNPAQKNALRTCLMLVEKGMVEVDRVLSGDEHHGLFFRIEDDLSEETKTGIRQFIVEARRILRELKDRFQLDLVVEGKSRAIFGKVPLLWEMVTDTDARRLRGYGEIDPRLKEVLDPSIEQLSQLLLRMHQLVSKNDEKLVQKQPDWDGE